MSDIKTLLSSVREVSFFHVPRIDNRVADRVAHLCRSAKCLDIYFDSGIQNLIRMDALGKTAGELMDKIKAMSEAILKAMARSLDLQEDCFLKTHGLDGGFTVKLSIYPPCPNPDRVLGFAPHSDGTTFTMLFQDSEGLEFMANDRWFKVPVIPGALFINVGDLMEIMSNGVIKSTIHRVVTNSEKERFSVGMFYSSSSFKEIGPVEELVTADRPQLYTKTTSFEYAQVYRECSPKGMRPLFAFKVV